MAGLITGAILLKRRRCLKRGRYFTLTKLARFLLSLSQLQPAAVSAHAC
jgi:hypothetical protein